MGRSKKQKLLQGHCYACASSLHASCLHAPERTAIETHTGMHACTSDSIWADLQTTFKLSMSCPRFLVKTCIVRLKPRRDSWRQQLKVANKLSMSRGRPAGMVERELSPDEMAAVSAEISAGVPLDVLASLPLLTSSRCLDFLDRAAEKGIQKSRLQEFHWLLKPLCSVEPRLILGHSSLQGVLRKVMETLMPILGVGSSDVLAGSLARVKILPALRRPVADTHVCCRMCNPRIKGYNGSPDHFLLRAFTCVLQSKSNQGSKCYKSPTQPGTAVSVHMCAAE